MFLPATLSLAILWHDSSGMALEFCNAMVYILKQRKLFQPAASTFMSCNQLIKIAITITAPQSLQIIKCHCNGLSSISWGPNSEKVFCESAEGVRPPRGKGLTSGEVPELPGKFGELPGKFVRSEKAALNIKFLGGIFLGHPGPRRRDIPDKNFMQVAFFCCFRQGVAGMSRDLGRDVPDVEKTLCKKTLGWFFVP